MTRAVWKYELPFDINQVSMPEGARVLDVQATRGVPTIYALVDPEAPRRVRTFRRVVTSEVFEGDVHDYVASVRGGVHVWHIFEVHP